MADGLSVTAVAPVDRALLGAPSPEVAPLLLNLLVVVGERVGRIVEVEAYGGEEDPASHAFRGRRAANSSMFAQAGTLYCYRSYGIHTCANVVTGGAGEGQAVLIRALEPLCGLDEMRRARPRARSTVDLADGPGKLCQAMGITLDHDGLDLCAEHSAVRLCTDGLSPPTEPAVGPRVGITRGVDEPWRFSVAGNAHLWR